MWWFFVIGSLSSIFRWISEIVDFTNWIWNHLELVSKYTPIYSFFTVKTIDASRCILCVIYLFLSLNALIYVFLAGGVCTIFGEYLGPRLKKMEKRWAAPVLTQTSQWRKPNGFYLFPDSINTNHIIYKEVDSLDKLQSISQRKRTVGKPFQYSFNNVYRSSLLHEIICIFKGLFKQKYLFMWYKSSSV